MVQGGMRARTVAVALIAGACAVTVLATSADARWRRYYDWSERYSARSEPPPETQSEAQFQRDGRRRRDGEFADSGRRGRGAFAAVVERLIRGCAGQGLELKSWPFEAIAQAVAPDDAQRAALEGLRDTTRQAAETLASTCPQAVPPAPAARLEAVEQAIDAASVAFAAVQPALEGFYGTLDDEQKARIVRGMDPQKAQASRSRSARPDRDLRQDLAREELARADSTRDDSAREGLGRDAREGMSRRELRRAYAEEYRWRRYGYRERRRGEGDRERGGAAASWGQICEHLTVALRGWPIREIERGVRLSETQRVSFYELVTASLKAADTLASACPAETALTPAGRMDIMRKRLAAVRDATAAIRPALLRFYGALDQGQKVRFAEMS
jgi:LTXXQ motif family protein